MRRVPGLAAVLLAGGEGRRLAGHRPRRDKGALAVGGWSLAWRAASALVRETGGGLRVAASQRRGWYRRLPGVERVIPDPGGRPGGPAAGLAAAPGRAPWVAVLPCDALPPPPGWTAALVGRARRAGAPVGVGLAGGRPAWTHLVFRGRLRRDLLAYLGSGGASLQGWVRRHRWAALELGPLRQANRPGELRRLRLRAVRRPFRRRWAR